MHIRHYTDGLLGAMVAITIEVESPGSLADAENHPIIAKLEAAPGILGAWIDAENRAIFAQIADPFARRRAVASIPLDPAEFAAEVITLHFPAVVGDRIEEAWA